MDIRLQTKEEATIKKIAISKSNQAYVLADSNLNLLKVSLCKVADFHQVTMVTSTTKEQADLRYRMAGEAFVLLKNGRIIKGE